MRMKRHQGYKHIKCPHCDEKIKLVFRTMHRMKIEVEDPYLFAKRKEEEGDHRG